MSNTSFLASHEALLKDQGRLRVAKQLYTVLLDVYKNNHFKNLKILDYGCSTGVITNFLAGYAKDVTGIDVDKNAIEIAKKKFTQKNLSFLLNSGIKIPFKDSAFDLVICNQVYSYLEEPDLMLEEIHRVLKPEGYCLFTGDNLLRPIEPLYNLPFIRLFPKSFTMLILKTLGYKNTYLGTYKTYWGIVNLCRNFEIHDYTLKVLKNPEKYKYKNLEKYSSLLKGTPTWFLKVIEPFLPSFIFLLKKTRT